MDWVAPVATLARSSVCVWRSQTKMSLAALVSPGTRLVAEESKATQRPSGLIATVSLPAWLFPCVPSAATLARWVVPV